MQKDLKQLKEEYRQFEFPQFIKDFLSKMAETPTFVNQMKLTDIHDEFEKDYVSKNKWLFFGYNFGEEKTFEQFKNRQPLTGKLSFGHIGRYQYEKILNIQIIFENEIAQIKEGICYGLRCSRAKIHWRDVPKHSKHLVEELFENYKKWLKGEID